MIGTSATAASAAAGGQAVASGGHPHVPKDVARRFPQLVPMILHSQAMKDGEKEYWLSMLPIMKPNQVNELQNILQEEQSKKEKPATPAIDAEARKKAHQQRHAEEGASRDEDENLAEMLLDEL